MVEEMEKVCRHEYFWGVLSETPLRPARQHVFPHTRMPGNKMTTAGSFAH